MIGYRQEAVFQDMEEGWPALLRSCLEGGAEATPRGYKTLELPPTMFVLTDPGRAIVTSPARKLNHAFGAVEFLWVVAGQDEVETLAFFNSKMRDFADQPKYTGDASVSIPNARLFGAYGVPIKAQLPYVMEALDDKDSRQAVLTIWRPSPPKTKDVPCTVMLQFLLRGDRLHMMTVMRSNDLWLGTPYDVPLFCRLQSYVASRLGVPMGTYTHVAGSLHLYERDLDSAREAARPRHPGVRPANLVVGPFDPTVNPETVWESVERFAAGIPGGITMTRGWGELALLAYEYASRKRQREKADGQA